jgi:hypothetical protein
MFFFRVVIKRKDRDAEADETRLFYANIVDKNL